MKKVINYIKENYDIILAWFCAGIAVINAIVILIAAILGIALDSDAITSANNAAVAANNAVRVIVFG